MARTRPYEKSLFWLLAAAFVLETLDFPPPETAERLDAGLDECGLDDWREHVQMNLRTGRDFIRSVYALCTEFRGPEGALCFILRGFGCRKPDKQFMKLLDGARPTRVR